MIKLCFYINTYNDMERLSESIQQILLYYQDNLIFIFDDHSNDNNLFFLKKLTEKNKNLILLDKKEKKMGWSGYYLLLYEMYNFKYIFEKYDIDYIFKMDTDTRVLSKEHEKILIGLPDICGNVNNGISKKSYSRHLVSNDLNLQGFVGIFGGGYFIKNNIPLIENMIKCWETSYDETICSGNSYFEFQEDQNISVLTQYCGGKIYNSKFLSRIVWEEKPKVSILPTPEEKYYAIHPYRNNHSLIVPYPIVMDLESTRFCNVNPPCVMCCRNVWNDPDNLSDTVLSKIKEISKYIHTVSFHGIGETLLYPKIEELIKIFKNSYCGFTTGGHLFSEEKIKLIVDSKLNFISISIDSSKKETHDKIRGTGFDKIIENILLLQNYKKKSNTKYPLLKMNAVVMKENINECADMIKLAWELGATHFDFVELIDSLSFIVTKNNFLFDYEQQKTKHIKDKHDIELAKAAKLAYILGNISVNVGNIYNKDLFKEIYDQYTYDGYIERKVDTNNTLFGDISKNILYQDNKIVPCDVMCNRPWRTVWIDCRGNVQVCCHQCDSAGSLLDYTFEEIWFGDKMKKMREEMIFGILPEACANSLNICQVRKNINYKDSISKNMDNSTNKITVKQNNKRSLL